MDVFMAVIAASAAAFGGIAVWQARKAARAGSKQAEDDRLRHEQNKLQKILLLAQQIRADAMEATRAAIARGDGPSDTWRTATQERLFGELTGMKDLPRCLGLTQVRGIATVPPAAIAAEREVQAAFHKLQDGHG
jgi:hypothetical protein